MWAPTRLFSSFLILLSVGLICPVSIPASTGETDQATALPKPRPDHQKKVITNEDLQRLPSELGVSAFLRPPQLDPATPEGEQRLAASPDKASIELGLYVKETDPHWYLEQMNSLRMELEGIDSTVQRIREFRKSSIGMTSGITLGQPSLRLSPENELEQLALRRREVGRQIDELEDTARHKGFLPGFLRSSLFASGLLETALGPKEKRPLTPEQARTAWQEKLRPLVEELAQVEGVVERMDKEAAARGMTLYAVTVGGSPTADLLGSLKARTGALQQEISTIEDEARRASVPPGWLR